MVFITSVFQLLIKVPFWNLKNIHWTMIGIQHHEMILVFWHLSKKYFSPEVEESHLWIESLHLQHCINVTGPISRICVRVFLIVAILHLRNDYFIILSFISVWILLFVASILFHLLSFRSWNWKLSFSWIVISLL